METQHQSGKIVSLSRDRSRHAMTPGWRLSKNGNRYFESRKNRSDKKGSKI